MFHGRGQIREGLKAVFKPDQQMNMRCFFTDLCSSRKEVRDEMMDDPLLRKDISLGALIATDRLVDKTAHWGKKTDPHLSVLILQGSGDGCVSPKHVTDLMNNMKSEDQTLAWRGGNSGHLQLETCFMRAQTIDAVAQWLVDHSNTNKIKLQGFQKEIAGLGGTVTE